MSVVHLRTLQKDGQNVKKRGGGHTQGSLAVKNYGTKTL